MNSKFNKGDIVFCVGNNVIKFPEVFQSMLQQGHSIGNHTFNHINGWKNADEIYLSNSCDTSFKLIFITKCTAKLTVMTQQKKEDTFYLCYRHLKAIRNNQLYELTAEKSIYDLSLMTINHG